MEMQVLHLHAVVEHLPDLVHLEEMPGNSHWRNWPMRSDYVGRGAEIVHQGLGPGCQFLLLESHELWLSYLTQNRSLLFSLLYIAVVTEEIIVQLKENKYQHMSGLRISNSRTDHLAETIS